MIIIKLFISMSWAIAEASSPVHWKQGFLDSFCPVQIRIAYTILYISHSYLIRVRAIQRDYRIHLEYAYLGQRLFADNHM
jgi:hypothetical protein